MGVTYPKPDVIWRILAGRPRGVLSLRRSSLSHRSASSCWAAGGWRVRRDCSGSNRHLLRALQLRLRVLERRVVVRSALPCTGAALRVPRARSPLGLGTPRDADRGDGVDRYRRRLDLRRGGDESAAPDECGVTVHGRSRAGRASQCRRARKSLVRRRHTRSCRADAPRRRYLEPRSTDGSPGMVERAPARGGLVCRGGRRLGLVALQSTAGRVEPRVRRRRCG